MFEGKVRDRRRRLAAALAAWHLVGFFLVPLVHLALAAPAHSAHECPICTSLQQPPDVLAGGSAENCDPVLAAGQAVVPASTAAAPSTPVRPACVRAPPAV